jgi:hypothetical protein
VFVTPDCFPLIRGIEGVLVTATPPAPLIRGEYINHSLRRCREERSSPLGGEAAWYCITESVNATLVASRGSGSDPVTTEGSNHKLATARGCDTTRNAQSAAELTSQQGVTAKLEMSQETRLI